MEASWLGCWKREEIIFPPPLFHGPSFLFLFFWGGELSERASLRRERERDLWIERKKLSIYLDQKKKMKKKNYHQKPNENFSLSTLSLLSNLTRRVVNFFGLYV